MKSRRKILAAIGTGTGIALAGCTADDTSDDEETDDEETDDEETDDEDNENDDNVYEIGETFVIEERSLAAEYTVTDVPTVTDRIGIYETNELFIPVPMRIRNVGDESFRLSLQVFFNLIDMEGREFEPSLGPSDIELGNMNPGVTREGDIVFEVPRRDAGYNLRLRGQQVFTTAEPVVVPVGNINL